MENLAAPGPASGFFLQGKPQAQSSGDHVEHLWLKGLRALSPRVVTANLLEA